MRRVKDEDVFWAWKFSHHVLSKFASNEDFSEEVHLNPGHFSLSEEKEAYFYLSFLFCEPTGSLAVFPWSRRNGGFKGIPVLFRQKPTTTIRETLPSCSMCSLNTSLLDAFASSFFWSLQACIFFCLFSWCSLVSWNTFGEWVVQYFHTPEQQTMLVIIEINLRYAGRKGSDAIHHQQN